LAWKQIGVCKRSVCSQPSSMQGAMLLLLLLLL
jgi:hypothetical protein